MGPKYIPHTYPKPSTQNPGPMLYVYTDPYLGTLNPEPEPLNPLYSTLPVDSRRNEEPGFFWQHAYPGLGFRFWVLGSRVWD